MAWCKLELVSNFRFYYTCSKKRLTEKVFPLTSALTLILTLTQTLTLTLKLNNVFKLTK